MEQKPSIGRTVHYHNYIEDSGFQTYAALITQVNPDNTVELVTFGINSVYFQHGIEFSETPKDGRWGWPPRV